MKVLYRAAPTGDALTCSSCGQPRELLLSIPITGFLRGWRQWLGASGVQPWIGVCESCLRQWVRGFRRARPKARALGADVSG